MHFDFEIPVRLFYFLSEDCRSSDNFTHMVVQQTVVVVSGLMQTAWHQPAS